MVCCLEGSCSPAVSLVYLLSKPSVLDQMTEQTPENSESFPIATENTVPVTAPPQKPQVFKLLGSVTSNLVLEGPSGKRIPLDFNDALRAEIAKKGGNELVMGQLKNCIEELTSGEVRLSARVKTVAINLQSDGEITVEPCAPCLLRV
jgi:hypothetical protein